MKIDKEELEKIILEEVMKEMDTSATAIKKGMRGQQMQKNVSSAGTGGRETIARLQRVIQTIGQQKMSTVPAQVKMALQKLEAALGIQSNAGATQQGDAQ
tara:strand:- start:13571 stop:13870 length:300 start_codon:yes stop_codon:yes gene_type:complete